MKYTFSNPNYVTKDYLTFQILDESGIEIGSAEGAGNKYGDFISVVKIYDSANFKYGIGFAAFQKAFELIDSDFPITTIKASWNKDGEFKDFENGMSTNLLEYSNHKKVMSDIDAAKNTPTGKWCRKLGFVNCTIIRDTSDNVEVNFTK
ncbi:hypothetical protein [Flavobacterium hydatis]|uniref:Uncharacterized protein n=1 Tax=Flavobacterium hydatis TaxID=991 RepID=A0A086AKS7_FLAHY|nr:hypothetical protein [Flavobacterium hydatis]KFF17291.1 hypothetical protein IW20_08075 [Flavobacterium hydatis]OXA95126.1 hypothetical protein B0A62_09490 [Flavobacterium hydatis]